MKDEYFRTDYDDMGAYLEREPIPKELNDLQQKGLDELQQLQVKMDW